MCRFRYIKIANNITVRTPSPTPTPIPAFAPADRFCGGVGEAAGSEVLDVVMDVALELGRSELCQLIYINGARILYCDMTPIDTVLGTVKNVNRLLVPDKHVTTCKLVNVATCTHVCLNPLEQE
jgi:hypothetical protein